MPLISVSLSFIFHYIPFQLTIFLNEWNVYQNCCCQSKLYWSLELDYYMYVLFIYIYIYIFCIILYFIFYFYIKLYYIILYIILCQILLLKRICLKRMPLMGMLKILKNAFFQGNILTTLLKNRLKELLGLLWVMRLINGVPLAVTYTPAFEIRLRWLEE